MAKPPKKIDEGEYRFDCECGRIHLFSAEEGGKMKVETIEPKSQRKPNDEEEGNDDGKKPKDPKPAPPKRTSLLSWLD